MADYEEELNGLFQMPGESTLPPDVLGELQSTIRLHSLSPQELFYKWESYCIKMGAETLLNLDTAREFKKDIQEVLDREVKGKAHMRGSEKRTVHATPRATVTNDDVFGMYVALSLAIFRSTHKIRFDNITPKTPASSISKRKAAFETPAPKSVKSTGRSSPTNGLASEQKANGKSVPFSERQNIGQIIETLNGHLDACELIAPAAEPRIKFRANTDLPKYNYRPLAMHLSEASEVLDDRIDEFAQSVQKHHNLDESAFGNAASKSTNEIIVVGRIASDTPDSKMNANSIVIEMSRKAGAGLRVPLKFRTGVTGSFFPGQIVALRGTNASGDSFTVAEVLEIPMLPASTSPPSAIEATNERLGIEDIADASALNALNVIMSSGPYTADDNLDFEPLKALCDKAIETSADVLILVGPLLDTEHPLIASGDFELPDDPLLEPDRATMSDAFRILVSKPLQRLVESVPNITILIVASARDVVNKHVSWPQAAIPKRDLGLPKQAKTVPNPVIVTCNDMVVGISAQDILYDLRLSEASVGAPKESNLLTRLTRHIIQQAHFFPLFPPVNREWLPKPSIEDAKATGTPLDTSYLKLGEWPNTRPDLLVLPSALPPFAKVQYNLDIFLL